MQKRPSTVAEPTTKHGLAVAKGSRLQKLKAAATQISSPGGICRMGLWFPYEGTGCGESTRGRIEKSEIRSRETEGQEPKPLRGLLVASTPRKSTQLCGFSLRSLLQNGRHRSVVTDNAGGAIQRIRDPDSSANGASGFRPFRGALRCEPPPGRTSACPGR
jgi:hypothetical protein